VPHIGRRIDVIVRGADNGFWRKTIFSLTL
jgi:hypothetical protein